MRKTWLAVSNLKPVMASSTSPNSLMSDER